MIDIRISNSECLIGRWEPEVPIWRVTNWMWGLERTHGRFPALEIWFGPFHLLYGMNVKPLISRRK